MDYTELEKISEPIICAMARRFARQWAELHIDEAEIAQVARIKIWNRAYLAKDVSTLSAWVATVARREIINHLKRTTRLKGDCLEIKEEIVGTNCPDLRSCNARLETEWIINNLPAKYRRIATLYSQGYNQQEMCEVLGWSKGHMSKMMKTTIAHAAKIYHSDYSMTA